MKTKRIIFTVIGILLLIIFIQNSQVVTFHLLLWKIEISRLILIPLLMTIGFVIGYVTREYLHPRKKSKN